MAAIITSTSFLAGTGLTATGADLTALASICASVDTAIRRMIYPFVVEPATLTDIILDAPNSNELVLPVVPVRSITSIYYRPDANGVLANFTSDFLLDNSAGGEYYLKLDRPVDAYSRSGIVQRRVTSMFGGERSFANRLSLAPSWGPGHGALKVTWLAGPLSIPDDIFEAAKLATALLYTRRKTGLPVTNESWNGYSYGTAGPFTATAALRSPDVLALLQYYLPGFHTAQD